MAQRVLIAMGSNLGDRRANLRQALRLLSIEPGFHVQRKSDIYETAAEGMRLDEPSKPFLNAVVEVETALTPLEVLSICLKIEALLGRHREADDKRWGHTSRTLDLDVLFYGEQQSQAPGLELPHPRLAERAFVLIPLAEVVPHWVHPVLNQTVSELLHPFKSAAVHRINNAWDDSVSCYS